jgi:hypothetical protein
MIKQWLLLCLLIPACSDQGVVSRQPVAVSDVNLCHLYTNSMRHDFTRLCANQVAVNNILDSNLFECPMLTREIKCAIDPLHKTDVLIRYRCVGTNQQGQCQWFETHRQTIIF